ncbi:MAG TPA: hypothetical protein VN673_00820 [Clostridia bacterium]|nr:hypothetical protein [Clostridia bacterium]
MPIHEGNPGFGIAKLLAKGQTAEPGSDYHYMRRETPVAVLVQSLVRFSSSTLHLNLFPCDLHHERTIAFACALGKVKLDRLHF